VRLFELKPRGLEGRFFGGITLYPNKDSSSASGGNGSAAYSDEEEQQTQQGTISARATINEELQAVVGEGYVALCLPLPHPLRPGVLLSNFTEFFSLSLCVCGGGAA
jgi:hypothetical protein